jgi:hypothetical protein
MSKSGKQWYTLTLRQLTNLMHQGLHPQAQVAWDLSQSIRDIGGGPKIYFSEGGGFRVIDERDLGLSHLLRTMDTSSIPYQ